MSAGRIRPPRPSQYTDMAHAHAMKRTPAPNNFKAPSAKGDYERIRELLYRNGFRNASPTLRKKELTWIMSTCLGILTERDAKQEVYDKAEAYDQIMDARSKGREVVITRREYDALLGKAELLDLVDRDERQRAIGRRKRLKRQ